MGWLTVVLYTPYSTAFIPITTCQCENCSDLRQMLIANECNATEKTTKSGCNCENSSRSGYRDHVAQSHEELELMPKMTTVLTNNDYEFHKGRYYVI